MEKYSVLTYLNSFKTPRENSVEFRVLLERHTTANISPKVFQNVFQRFATRIGKAVIMSRYTVTAYDLIKRTALE